MRSAADIEAALAQHGDTVLRVASIYLRDRADREDIYQEVFLCYAQSAKEFAGEEHKRAWLIRVAANLCKDHLKRASQRVESLDSFDGESLGALASAESADAELLRQQEPGPADVPQALMRIDEKYRIALYLKYYENYRAAQIAALLQIPENTVYTYLSRGKKQLKEVLARGR